MFIDSSKESLIVALLRNYDTDEDKKEPPLILLYSENCKENRTSIESCLNLLDYNKHEWLIIGKYLLNINLRNI